MCIRDRCWVCLGVCVWCVWGEVVEEIRIRIHVQKVVTAWSVYASRSWYQWRPAKRLYEAGIVSWAVIHTTAPTRSGPLGQNISPRGSRVSAPHAPRIHPPPSPGRTPDLHESGVKVFSARVQTSQVQWEGLSARGGEAVLTVSCL